MEICEYGCERKAKHQFKNGKWCCSKNYKQCFFQKKLMEGKKHSEETKKKISKAQKGKTLSKEHREKISKAKKGNIPWNLGKAHTEEIKKKISEAKRGVRRKPFSKTTRKKLSESNKKKNKLTIKKIKEKYPFFSKIEELRYNPDKPEEIEIQVHCKNHNCPNSKEQGGWFTPTYGQLYERIRALERPTYMIENNFYCSQECKDNCPCYNLKSDLFQLSEYQQYYKKVWKYTNLSLKYNSDKIPNIQLRGKKYSYDLDHKFSILDGFNNNIDVKVIGNWRNLEVIKMSDNRIKSRNSSISLEMIQKIGEILNE